MPGPGASVSLVCLLILIGLAPGRAKAAPSAWVPVSAPGTGPAWDYILTLADLSVGLAEVEVTARGLPAESQFCADMDGAERYVSEIRQVRAGPDGRDLERKLSRDEMCWSVRPEAPGGRVRLRYHYDLGALARDTGDPDYGTRIGDNYIFNDGSVFLRPEPLPPHAPIRVEFRLPKGVLAATPWERLPGPGLRFQYDSEQYDAGNYLAVGRLCPLGELKIKSGTAVLTSLSCEHRASDDELRRWVSRALTAVAEFYGELPGIRPEILLAPVPGNDTPGVFGSILHKRIASAVLFFGADAAGQGFEDDWMATHELFHLGNAPVQEKIPWFTEGFTTYYQDVLRGRGMQPVDRMWGDLYDGFRRFCDPNPDGKTLGEESRRLHELHHYTRAYWGGACLAFMTDVSIREHSGNKQGLDDVLRALLREGRKDPLSETQIIAALDRAAGQPIVQRFLRSRSKAPLEGYYRRLGIEPTGAITVRLHEEAPLAAIRKAIF